MNDNEKNLSAKQCSQKTHSWISYEDEHNCGSRRFETATGQRAQTLDSYSSSQTCSSIKHLSQSFRFHKSSRLLTRREFLFLQSRGKRCHCPHFVLIFSPARKGKSRLGVTVTRRFGKAVQRNRMKRLLREFFRVNGERISPAQDVLIIPRAGAHKLALCQITEEIGRALSFVECVS